jgi:predicted RNA-binding protein with PUA-like domain
MAYWLFKTEPETFSWDDQLKRGEGSEEWSGVRNVVAQANMRKMQIGDLGFFYHSGKERSVVGIVRVVSDFHPDSTDETGKWSCVDVTAVAPFPKPVTLAEIKARPDLSDMILVRNSRLSVQPVTEHEWRTICEMGGADPDARSGEAPRQIAPRRGGSRRTKS